MFKSHNIIFALFITLNLQGLYCQELNKLNKHGNKQGVWKENFDDPPNIDYALITYDNDIRNGELKSFYKNGNVATCLNYKNGKIDGTLKNFYPNGKLKYSVNYDLGLKDGLHKEFTNEGILKAEKKYCSGTICDYYKLYYDNGNLFISVRIYHNKEGYKIEKWEVFYESGKLKATGEKKKRYKDRFMERIFQTR